MDFIKHKALTFIRRPGFIPLHLAALEGKKTLPVLWGCRNIALLAPFQQLALCLTADLSLPPVLCIVHVHITWCCWPVFLAASCWSKCLKNYLINDLGHCQIRKIKICIQLRGTSFFLHVQWLARMLPTVSLHVLGTEGVGEFFHSSAVCLFMLFAMDGTTNRTQLCFHTRDNWKGLGLPGSKSWVLSRRMLPVALARRVDIWLQTGGTG